MFNRCILSTHVFVDKSELPNIGALRESLTFTSKFDAEVGVPTFLERDGMFGFPRYHFPLTRALASNIVDERAIGSPISFEFKLKLWDYQEQIVKEFKDAVKKGGTGFFLNAAPGSGKTICGVKFIQVLGTKTLVVVPKSDLVQQWVDRILFSTNLSRTDIAIATNGGLEAHWRDASIVVGLVHTLGLKRFYDDSGAEFVDSFGAVLYDEADHSIPPSTFAPVACMFPAKYRIGMTATRKRSDGLHRVFEKHLGQIYIEAKASNTMKPAALQVFYTKSSGSFTHGLEYKFRRGQILTKIGGNQERSALVAKYVYKCYAKSRDVLVLSDRKEQLKDIREFLLDLGAKDEDIGFFVRTLDKRTLKKDYLQEVIDNCRIILATYGMGSRGTDIPRLSALVLASPQMSMTQIAGRIERFQEGKRNPIIIDFIDTAYDDMVKGGLARFKQYEKRGLTIKTVREA